LNYSALASGNPLCEVCLSNTSSSFDVFENLVHKLRHLGFTIEIFDAEPAKVIGFWVEFVMANRVAQNGIVIWVDFGHRTNHPFELMSSHHSKDILIWSAEDEGFILSILGNSPFFR
jgi:hypothetical protein